MSIQVPPDIVGQTDKCLTSFACLAGGRCACDVLYPPGDEAVLVRGPQASECLYAVQYGEIHICRCPILLRLCRTGELKHAP